MARKPRQNPRSRGPEVSSVDRFGFTLFLSVVINAIVILGVSFSMDEIDPDEFMAPTLDVTLVPTESDIEPDEADFYAQANQDAGGDQEEKMIPTTVSPSPFTTADDSASPLFMPKVEQQPKPRQTNDEILTADRADFKIFSEEKDPEELPDTKTLTTPELMARSQEIAKLSAQLDKQIQAYANKPREKFLSVRTKKNKHAKYIFEWTKQIESVGEHNFPGEAKRRNLYGNLLLDVGIFANGTIANITVRRSSGYKLLDDAAVNIVRIAAPFKPFPKNIKKDTDIIHITRTWKFLPGGDVKTGVE